MPSPQATLAPITPDHPGFAALLAESRDEGHNMLLRFAENWHSGANVFDRSGELIFGATSNATLIGICGRNIDPYDPATRAGRIRHLYVSPERRRHGIGRLLIEAICRDALRHFDYLNTNAPPGAFAFYESLDFHPKPDTLHITHRLPLTKI